MCLQREKVDSMNAIGPGLTQNLNLRPMWLGLGLRKVLVGKSGGLNWASRFGPKLFFLWVLFVLTFICMALLN